MDADRNGLEVLIADEAHRIRETSANRWTSARLRTGRPQIDELIAAARVPVFLLDEHQVVRPGEMGTVEDIEAHAKRAGLAVHKIPLDAHFRCGGSEEYLQWVVRLLGLAPGGPLDWIGDPAFSVRLADAPAGDGAPPPDEARCGVRGPDRGRVLLALERPAARRLTRS